MKITCLCTGCIVVAGALVPWRAQSQVAMSDGPLTQTFDTLSTSGTENAWSDNATLVGWYASRSAAPNTVTNYRASTGSSTAGALYSFGVAGVNPLTDRALGSLGSGTVGDLAYGVRLRNNTGVAVSHVTVRYTGEQWRDANATAHALTFAYLRSDQPLTNADAAGSLGWVGVPALDFVGPATAVGGALDGNNAVNRVALSHVLAGVVVDPGEELFLRWFDADDTGSDHGLGIDDVQVSWQGGTTAPVSPPLAYRLDAAGLVLSWTNPAFSLAWGADAASMTNKLTGVTSPHTNALSGAGRLFRLIWP